MRINDFRENGNTEDEFHIHADFSLKIFSNSLHNGAEPKQKGAVSVDWKTMAGVRAAKLDETLEAKSLKLGNYNSEFKDLQTNQPQIVGCFLFLACERWDSKNK